MRDPYCVGFWISTVLALSAIGIYFTGVWLDHDLDKAFAYLNAIGTLLAGLAGLLVAGVTLYGLHLWKVQLYHGKYLAVIWDTQSALRRVESTLIELTVSSLSLDKDTTDAELFNRMRESSFGAALAVFAEKCQVLDRLVVKNQWEWSNYAQDIETAVHASLRQTLEFKFISGFPDRLKHQLRSASQASMFRKFVDRLNEMLDELESKYGV
ncbi:hypothetical protein [Pseudomonas oryzihabitans]|uniref:hypothetical protein n=1 Tax=Pseudomonas oryzihabitans TaxID=47885 RepID=UPI003F9E968B